MTTREEPASTIKFQPRCKGARQHCKSNSPRIVIVHLIVEAGSSLVVMSAHTVQVDRASIGKNDSCPHYLDASLTVRNHGIVGPEEARTLRDEKILPRGCVVYVRAHQR